MAVFILIKNNIYLNIEKVIFLTLKNIGKIEMS